MTVLLLCSHSFHIANFVLLGPNLLLKKFDRLVEFTLLLAVLLLLDHQGVVLVVVCFEITLGSI